MPDTFIPYIRCDIAGFSSEDLGRIASDLKDYIEMSYANRGPSAERCIKKDRMFSTEEEFREEHARVVQEVVKFMPSETVKSRYQETEEGPPKYQAEN